MENNIIEEEIITEEEVIEEKAAEDETLLLKNQILRITADFENYKKRKEEENLSNIKYANNKLITELLPIIDNFERAIKYDNDNDLTDELSKFLDGFKMVYTNFENLLSTFKVTEIKALNEPFDPNVHMAVLTEKQDSVESGIVLEVFQKGYKIEDRVLRPAMVKVSE